MNPKKQKKDISINVGAGVPKLDVELDTTHSPFQQPVEEIPEVSSEDFITDSKPEKIQFTDINDKFILNSVGQKTYWNKPYFKGQSKSLGMFKYGHPKVQLFTLDSEENIQKYNDFLAQMGGEGEDPLIVNVSIEKEFWQGHFIVLVSYNEVWYILPDQK